MQKGAPVHFILVSYRRLDNPSGSIRGLERRAICVIHQSAITICSVAHTQVVKFHLYYIAMLSLLVMQ